MNKTKIIFINNFLSTGLFVPPHIGREERIKILYLINRLKLYLRKIMSQKFVTVEHIIKNLFRLFIILFVDNR